MAIDVSSDSYKYVSEFVWLPTYISVAVIALGGFGGGPGGLYVLLSLIGCRVILEFVYRCAFGPARLTRAVGVTAFASQLVAWSIVWGTMYLISASS